MIEDYMIIKIKNAVAVDKILCELMRELTIWQLKREIRN